MSNCRNEFCSCSHMRNLFTVTVVFCQIKVLYCVWIASVISQCMFVCISGLFLGGFFFGNQVCMTLAQRLWRKRFLKTPHANFHSFLTNSPMKWTCPFIWNLNWKSLTPKDMVIPRLFDIDPKDLEKIFKTLKNKCVFHLS